VRKREYNRALSLCKSRLSRRCYAHRLGGDAGKCRIGVMELCRGCRQGLEMLCKNVRGRAKRGARNSDQYRPPAQLSQGMHFLYIIFFFHAGTCKSLVIQGKQSAAGKRAERTGVRRAIFSGISTRRNLAIDRMSEV